MSSSPRRGNMRNTYFVDTKTTCFLCLQDIPPAQPPPPPSINLDEKENGGERVGGVDYKESGSGKEEGNREEESSQKRSKFCLRSICKYLKMDPWKVLSSRMAGESLDMIGVNLQNTDLLVTLCDDCTNVTTNLSKMCMELEIMDMEVDQSLRDFAVVLKDSISKPNLMEELKSKLASPSEQLQASVAESIGMRLRRSYKRLDESLPRVVLTNETAKNVSNRTGTIVPNLTPISTSARLSPPEVSILNVTAVKSKLRPRQIKCNVCELNFGSRSELVQHKCGRHLLAPTPTTSKSASEPYTSRLRHSKRHCPDRRTNPSTESPPKPPVEISKPPKLDRSKVTIPTADVLNKMLNPLPHFKNVNNQLLCSLCPGKSCYPYTSEDTLRKHLLTVHADFFFCPVKLDEVTEIQFLTICDENIEKEVDASYNGYNERNCPSYICVHCSDAYTEKRKIIVHLIESHYELLASKLVDLQRSKITKGLNPSYRYRDPGRRRNIKLRSGRWKCPDCQTIFMKSGSLCTHRRGTCIILDENRFRRRYDSIEIVPTPPVPPPNVPLTKYGTIRKLQPPVGSQGKWKCLDCGAGFASAGARINHRKRTNHWSRTENDFLHWMLAESKPTSSSPAQKNVACEFCDKKVSSQRYLKTHLTRTSCGLKAQQNAVGNPAVPTPTSPPRAIMAPVNAPAVVSTPPPMTPTEPASKKVPCVNCGKIMASLNSLYSHRRSHCPQFLKTMHTQGDLSAAKFMEQDYYEEQGEEEMMDEEENYQDAYVNSMVEVEVVEMSEDQSSDVMTDDPMVLETEDMFLDGRHGQPEAPEENCTNIEENQQNEK